MKLKIVLLIIAIIPGLLMSMEKEISRKRPAHVLEEPNEQNRAKIESFIACLPKLAPKPSKLVINETPTPMLCSFDEKPFKCDHIGCNFAAAYKSHLTTHKRTHTGEKPFKCDHAGCNYAATLKNDLTGHKRAHTGEKPYTCNYAGCNYAATHRIQLSRHKKKEHSNSATDNIVSVPIPLIATLNQTKPISASPLTASCQDTTDITMRKDTTSNQIPYEKNLDIESKDLLEEVDNALEDSSDSGSTTETASSPDTIQQDTITSKDTSNVLEEKENGRGKRSADELELDNTLESYENSAKVPRLTSPDNVQQTSASLLASILSSFDEKPFKCDHAGCNFATAYKTSLSGHKKIHTGEKPFRCDYAGCNYAATQKNHLTYHIKTHTDEKPFKCDHAGCNYAAADKSNLATHKRIHTGEKPFKCDHAGCNYATTEKGNLTKHKRAHSKNNDIVSLPTPLIAALNRVTPISASQLTAGYQHTTDITMSKDTTRNQIPFEKNLDIESKDLLEEPDNALEDSSESRSSTETASSPDTMQQDTITSKDITTHPSEKMYNCDRCDHAFAQKDALAEHKKTHSKIKAYQCDKCGGNFTIESGLTKHISNYHSDKKQHQCAYCDYATSYRSNLDYHEKTEHMS